MKNGKSLTPLHCARKGFIFEFRDSEVVYVDLSQMGSINLSIVFNLFKSVVQEFLRTTDSFLCRLHLLYLPRLVSNDNLLPLFFE